MSGAETAGIVALAYLVVRESFAMLRWAQNRRNNRNGNPGGHSSPETGARFDGMDSHLAAIDAELVRLRTRQDDLRNSVAILEGRWEMMKPHRPESGAL